MEVGEELGLHFGYCHGLALLWVCMFVYPLFVHDDRLFSLFARVAL